jgi:hypothetical protein
MGNFVNKNAADTVKNKSLSFDPPNSPAAVHQFLSNYQDKLGVKMALLNFEWVMRHVG